MPSNRNNPKRGHTQVQRPEQSIGQPWVVTVVGIPAGGTVHFRIHGDLNDAHLSQAINALQQVQHQAHIQRAIEEDRQRRQKEESHGKRGEASAPTPDNQS